MIRLGISSPGRSGKDEAAEYLAKFTPLRYIGGTSWFARHYMLGYMTADGHDYADAGQCWDDRHEHRQTWADAIALYNQDDPIRLYRDCMKEQDILTGVRWLNEFQACKAANLVDLWVWIERPGIEPDPTCQIRAEDCDITILNTGTLEEYRARLRRFANFLNKSRSFLTSCQ